ncbi:hypothetical protein O3M35_003782 [Rhynocoris fuscipes]|uniref:Nbr1 FW domain-containing protein n=1 Tax=Rhynocoris fuscipes TaxID=488301 RepID=A0AAW1CHP6_9HEMI
MLPSMDQFDAVDQQLLRQFSCLRTTDKDELVKQLQLVVGQNISAYAAQFFLDMNDWNLQAAVGSYFDCQSSAKLPSMCLVRDFDENTSVMTVPPNCVIRKVWLLLNNGDETWPEGCYLQFTLGESMCTCERIIVSELVHPGQTATIAAELKSPATPGFYTSKWRLATPTGTFFGDIIWVIMSVTETESSELIKQMSNLNTFEDNPSNIRPDSTCMVNPFGRQQCPSNFPNPQE